ncbi:3-deoxy-D-manno-octulosonic acid kinase [Marinobacter halophilus]|uniref:3-deoxy-D-manno-octulosonic acid kinase n=1 Tax=Marinobacter halophilus TaxID=1323740 RepID=UPI00166884BD|nr:3-deoxy-D-manno-octulosonic acid kinase [Marinobacter halophilus]
MARSFVQQFSEEWFDPLSWGDLAVPVTKGGRGSAWFIRSDAGDLVLRHFCRGGLPGRFIGREYVFTREDAVRSFSEFRLLDELFRRGYPVPEPVAAGYQRRAGLFYHAALIIRRIPGAVPLAEFASGQCQKTWQAAGECVRRFHDGEVYHADLNCMNILVAADKVYLIDFDRGKFMRPGQSDRWKAANVSRLQRSVSKCLSEVDDQIRDQLWQAFLAGYGSADQ